MATREQCAELVQQLGALGAVSRGVGRALPPECPQAAVIVLSLLARYGQMRASDLADRLDVDMSVTSRHVTYLVTRGWIERHPDPQDRRSRLLRLTPLGEAVLRQASDRIAEVFAEFLGDWTDEEVGRLAALMARLRASFDGGGPRAGLRGRPHEG